MREKVCGIAVIGGGASGMMAALAAAHAGADVTVLEAGSRVGRKLLATGNGRCNLSHRGFSAANYHGTHPRFVADALRCFNETDTLRFWHALGLETVVDGRERYYPGSLQSQAVLDLLRLSLEEAGVAVVTEARVTAVSHDGECFIISCGSRRFRARAVIMAAGGEASPSLGGCRDGYVLLERLGHTMIPTCPGIVQLECGMERLVAAAGLKRDVRLSFTRRDGSIAVSGEGELLLTKYGLSGPAVLEPSAAVVRALHEGPVTARINFFPEVQREALADAFAERRQAHPARTAEQFFIGLLPRMLGVCALKACRVEPRQPVSVKAVRALALLLSDWQVPVQRAHGLESAQVTLGGADTADFDPQTLASWIVPGLFACGEVLDVDGDCGGYNLQWAWSSGHLAGESAASWIYK